MKLGLLEWIARMACLGWTLVSMIFMNSRCDDDRRMRIYRKDALCYVLFTVPRVLGEYYFSSHPFSFASGKRVLETQQTESLLQAVLVFLLWYWYLCFCFSPLSCPIPHQGDSGPTNHQTTWLTMTLCKVLKWKMIGTYWNPFERLFGNWWWTFRQDKLV